MSQFDELNFMRAFTSAGRFSPLGPLGIWQPLSPSSNFNKRPYGLDDAERPCPLQKTIYRSQGTCAAEGQHKPWTLALEGIGYQHGRHSEQAEQRERVH